MSGPRRIVAVGAAGDMAGVCIDRLAEHVDGCTFDLYDLDADRLSELAAKLPPGSARTDRLDLFDRDALARAVEGATLVLLCAGPYLRTAPPVMGACIQAGVDYLDFDDDVESTRHALALDADTTAAGIACMVGCGASPGFTNVMALDAASRLDRVESIDIAWVSGDEGARPYGRAVLEHLLHIAAGEVPTWRDGREVTVEAGVANEVFALGGTIGDYRLYETGHPEPVTLPRHFPEARSIRVMGGLHPQPATGAVHGVARAVREGRMTVDEAVEWFQAVGQDQNGSLKGWRHALSGMLGQVRRRESSLADLGRYLRDGLRKRHPPYRGALMVRASGKLDGAPATVSLRTPTGGPDTTIGSSMAAFTGTCIAAFALLALEGDEHRGVLMPEDWVEPADFYAALQRAGAPAAEILEPATVERAAG
jgi:hypothetical protein